MTTSDTRPSTERIEAAVEAASNDYARRYDVEWPDAAASIQLAFIRGAEWRAESYRPLLEAARAEANEAVQRALDCEAWDDEALRKYGARNAIRMVRLSAERAAAALAALPGQAGEEAQA